MFTFYEYPKCSTCRRAKAELKELGLILKQLISHLIRQRLIKLSHGLKILLLQLKTFSTLAVKLIVHLA